MIKSQVCDCTWRIDTKGSDPISDSVCIDHTSETTLEPPPFEVIDIQEKSKHKKRQIGIFDEDIDSVNIIDESQTPFQCPKPFCRNHLSFDPKIVRVTDHGYEVSVDTFCPHHGLKEHHTLMSHGQDAKKQSVSFILSFKSWY